MTTQPNEELRPLPCPFCGGSAIFKRKRPKLKLMMSVKDFLLLFESHPRRGGRKEG